MKFFLNSQNRAYLRNLEEEFGESTNAIRIELNRFESAGFLESAAEGNKKIYTVNTKHPFYKDLNSIVMKATGLEYVVDYVISRLGALSRVYLVGNLAQGKDSAIIDLVLVGDNINKGFLLEQAEKAEKKIGKKIRYVVFSTAEFDLSQISETNMHPLLIWSQD